MGGIMEAFYIDFALENLQRVTGDNAEHAWMQDPVTGADAPVEIEKYVTPHVAHEVRDAKGRRCGGFATITAVYTYSVDEKTGYRVGYTLTGQYDVRIWATRELMRYGAVARTTRYDSLEAAKKGARKSLLAQRRRYHKVF